MPGLRTGGGVKHVRQEYTFYCNVFPSFGQVDILDTTYTMSLFDLKIIVEFWGFLITINIYKAILAFGICFTQVGKRMSNIFFSSLL